MGGWWHAWNGVVQTYFKLVSDLVRTQFKSAGFWGLLCTQCTSLDMLQRLATELFEFSSHVFRTCFGPISAILWIYFRHGKDMAISPSTGPERKHSKTLAKRSHCPGRHTALLNLACKLHSSCSHEGMQRSESKHSKRRLNHSLRSGKGRSGLQLILRAINAPSAVRNGLQQSESKHAKRMLNPVITVRKSM